MRVERLLEAAIYGENLERLARFYIDVLGLQWVAETPGRNVVLRCGPSALILFDPTKASQPGGIFPPHGRHGPGHIAFTVPIDQFPRWRQRLAQFNVEIEKEVEWADGQHSIYFRDPGGNSVELAPPTLWNSLGYEAAEPVRHWSIESRSSSE